MTSFPSGERAFWFPGSAWEPPVARLCLAPCPNKGGQRSQYAFPTQSLGNELRIV